MNTLRYTTILCVIQVVAIVACVLLTAKVHKIMRGIYGDTGWYVDHTHYSLWIRDYGAWLFAAPLLWIIIAISTHPVRAQYSKRIETVGLLLTFLVGLAAAVGVILCFRTPMIILIQK